MLRMAVLTLCLLATGASAGEVRHAVASDGAARIAYTDRGTGPAIVMVPSLGRGAGDFDDLADRLAAQGLRVICPEPRGIGGSHAEGADPSLHDLAADVALVAAQSGSAPVVVLGHAYGNTVARTFATERPDLVRGVILLAASGRTPLPADVRDAIARSSDLAVPPAQRRDALARAYFAPGNDASPWLDGWYPAVQAMELRAFNRSQPGDYVPAGGAMPILDVQGADDVIIPRSDSTKLRDELGARVTLVVVPRAGHALVPEQPAAVAAAIEGWMARFR